MDRIKALAIPGAIALAGLLVAVALLLNHRFEALQSANVLWITDRLTGRVTYCAYPTSVLDKWQTACIRVAKPTGP